MAPGAPALALALTGLAVGLLAGRWLRQRRRIDLVGSNGGLLTVAQGLLLLALLGGLDQRPLARAALFATPMALGLGLVAALGPSGEPLGRWWQIWRWRFEPARGGRRRR